jgi:hypothetical protein
MKWSRLGDLNPGPTHYEAFGDVPQSPKVTVTERVLLSFPIIFRLKSRQNRAKQRVDCAPACPAPRIVRRPGRDPGQRPGDSETSAPSPAPAGAKG